jgi:hypothetical protein
MAFGQTVFGQTVFGQMVISQKISVKLFFGSDPEPMNE